MHKLLFAFLLFFLFTSCNEKKNVKAPDTKVEFLSYAQAKKLIGEYTGRNDSSMYLHRWFIDVDGDTLKECVMVSEMISDPFPLLSVYFSKADTLIFLPLRPQLGTIPKIKQLYLLNGNVDQLGVWYNRNEEDGSSTYRITAFALKENSFKQLFDLPLYSLPKNGVVTDAKLAETVRVDSDHIELRLYEAELDLAHVDSSLSNSPLLVKKSKETYTVYVYNEIAQKFIPSTEQPQ